MKKARSAPRLTAAAVAMGIGLALALPGAANAKAPTESPTTHMVKLGHRAVLQTGGAAVLTSLSIICQPNLNAYLNITVTQVVSGSIVTGSTYRDISDCTGKQQDIKIAVTPQGAPFATGQAYGQAWLSYWVNETSRQSWDEHAINIT